MVLVCLDLQQQCPCSLVASCCCLALPLPLAGSQAAVTAIAAQEQPEAGMERSAAGLQVDSMPVRRWRHRTA